MHTHGVKVFDRTHHDDVVVLVSHELEFVLFPAQDGFFKQNLGSDRGLKPRTSDALKVGLVVSDSRTGAAHGEGRANHDGITPEFLDPAQTVIHSVRDD